MSQTFTVLWDGRRGGPGGQQLFTEEEQPVSNPTPEHRPRVSEATVRTSVTEHLERGPMTQRELVNATGFAIERINSALHAMRERGEARVVGSRPCDAVKYGRRIALIYGLTKNTPQ